METRQPMINRRHALLLARARFFPPHGGHMLRPVALQLAGHLARYPLRQRAGQQTRQTTDHLLRDLTHALVERLTGPVTGQWTRHGPVTLRVLWHVSRPVSIQFSNWMPAKLQPFP